MCNDSACYNQSLLTLANAHILTSIDTPCQYPNAPQCNPNAPIPIISHKRSEPSCQTTHAYLAHFRRFLRPGRRWSLHTAQFCTLTALTSLPVCEVEPRRQWSRQGRLVNGVVAESGKEPLPLCLRLVLIVIQSYVFETFFLCRWF
jgi:hypothetical protein